MAFSDQSRQTVDDYLTSLDDAFASSSSTGVPDLHAWDPFAHPSHHDLDLSSSLAVPLQPALPDESERASLTLVDFTGHAHAHVNAHPHTPALGPLGPGNGGFADSFQNMDLSLEHLLFADSAASALNPLSTPTSLTAFSAPCTSEHPMASLLPFPVYSEGSTNSPVGSPQSCAAFEEPSSYAAQEDKCQRNTAASARFRVKKKQRYYMREKSVKEVQDNIALLEANVAQLEIENKWLKDLASQKMEKMMANGVTK